MKQPVFYVYTNPAGNFGWTLRAGNGCVMAESPKAYARRRDCMRSIDSVLMAIFDARVEVIG